MLAAERDDIDDSTIPDKRLDLLLACAHPAIDPSLTERYQPYWTLVAELAWRRGDAATATAARSRAIELTADPAVRAHLEERWR